ncbi:hypothetical protein CDCA_CDCA18G4576 [Cyanidium caldarium]|uniref:Uncharacterized protein n=1 Tax=Cyanidium caldarium TaxID=2771 RepID=A0AAV9J2F1_CYACA|nr:hypothetical protein CDCA_CDCA18G4576 [Cyanidium caldarium]
MTTEVNNRVVLDAFSYAWDAFIPSAKRDAEELRACVEAAAAHPEPSADAVADDAVGEWHEAIREMDRQLSTALQCATATPRAGDMLREARELFEWNAVLLQRLEDVVGIPSAGAGNAAQDTDVDVEADFDRSHAPPTTPLSRGRIRSGRSPPLAPVDDVAGDGDAEPKTPCLDDFALSKYQANAVEEQKEKHTVWIEQAPETTSVSMGGDTSIQHAYEQRVAPFLQRQVSVERVRQAWHALGTDASAGSEWMAETTVASRWERGGCGGCSDAERKALLLALTQLGALRMEWREGVSGYRMAGDAVTRATTDDEESSGG